MPLSRKLLPGLAFGLASGLPLVSPATALADGRLAAAIRVFESGDEDGARKQLLAALTEGLPKPDQARAHVYLGLIALDDLDRDTAAAQLTLALKLDPLIELPRLSSPKARLLFDDLRRDRLAAGVTEGEAQRPAGSPPRTSGTTLETPAAAPDNPSLLPSILTLAAGAAVLAVGVGFGVDAQQKESAFNSTRDAKTALPFQAQAQASGRTADVLFGVAAAAGIAGAVLLILELPRRAAAQGTVGVGPNGAAVAF